MINNQLYSVVTRERSKRNLLKECSDALSKLTRVKLEQEFTLLVMIYGYAYRMIPVMHNMTLPIYNQAVITIELYATVSANFLIATDLLPYLNVIFVALIFLDVILFLAKICIGNFRNLDKKDFLTP